ncbi:hypothetical protein HK102_003696 [Quaeritorhiza haematococci]|nr:hypothetical protein HK102_003696 [Quaeritorhiza haematococci]
MFPPISTPNHLAKTAILLVLTIGSILIIVVSVTSILQTRDGDRQRDSKIRSGDEKIWAEIAQWYAPDDYVMALSFYVVAVDPRQYNVRLAATGTFFTVSTIEALLTNGEEDVLPSYRSPLDFTLVLGDREMPFRKDALFPRQEITLGILEGLPTKYPMDVYKSEFVMAAYRTVNGTTLPVPVVAETFSALQLFTTNATFSYSYLNQTLGSLLVSELTITRSSISIGVSIFIIIIMWLLSLSLFTLATSIWVRRKKVEATLLGVGTAMLFALPNVRNAQPGIGDVGSIGDVAGYIWNIVLVVAAGEITLDLCSEETLLLIWNYIYHNRADPAVLHKVQPDKKKPAAGPNDGAGAGTAEKSQKEKEKEKQVEIVKSGPLLGVV